MTRRSPRLVLPALVALLGLALVACGGDPQVSAGSPANPGGVLTSDGASSLFAGAEPAKPYRMPDVTLTSTNKQDFNLITDTAYPVTLVFFGYTHCPDVCPLVMNDLAQAVLQLPESVRSQTQVVYITSDPGRDTPEVLRRYLDHYNPDFVGLTGSMATIVRAADDLGVAIEGRHKLPSGGYDVGHGAQIIGFHGDTAPVLWTAGTPVSDIVHDIEALVRS